MKKFKKSLVYLSLLASFAGTTSFLTPSVSAKQTVDNSEYIANTKVPLKFQILGLAKHGYKLPDQSQQKVLKLYHNTISAEIKAGTKIKIYHESVFTKNGWKYYPVSFFKKPYTKLYIPDKGVFPTIAIKNFSQLKNIHKVSE